MILPGTKQTLDDLQWLRQRGFEDAVSKHPQVTGICGGLQMLGHSIEDPGGVESGGASRSIDGLGLLPLRTILQGEKTVRRASGQSLLWPAQVIHGYEIHMGETVYDSSARPFAQILRERDSQPLNDGAIHPSGRIWGTYLHGLFDDDAFRHCFLQSARQANGLEPAVELLNLTAQREARMDRWAAHVKKYLDMNLIRSWLEDPR